MANATYNSSIERERVPRLAQYESLTLMCAGIVAGATSTALMALARSLGLTSLNVEMLLGSLLMSYVGPSPWMVGFTLLLAVSALIALVYGVGFRRLGDAGPSIGAAFGVAHWIVSGIALGVLSRLHPLMPNLTPEVLLPPGFFAVNTGLFGFFFILLLHLIFGAIVGNYYRDVCLTPRRRPNTSQ